MSLREAVICVVLRYEMVVAYLNSFTRTSSQSRNSTFRQQLGGWKADTEWHQSVWFQDFVKKKLCCFHEGEPVVCWNKRTRCRIARCIFIARSYQWMIPDLRSWRHKVTQTATVETVSETNFQRNRGGDGGAKRCANTGGDSFPSCCYLP